MKPRIFIDLDGVIADLDSFMKDFHGEHWKEMEASYIWRPFTFTEPSLFYRVNPIKGAQNFIETILEKYGEKYYVAILTALPYPTGFLITAAKDKELWVRKYIHDTIPVYTVMGGVNKRYFVNSQFDILIDDTDKVIDKWTQYGGIGIRHKSFNQTLHLLGNITRVNN